MYHVQGGNNLKQLLKRLLADNFSALIAGPPGVGKSLPPDEKIAVIRTESEDSMMSVPISEVKEGDKVIGLDSNNRVKVTEVKRKAVFEHNGVILTVKTKSGKVVKATPDHSFLVLDVESGKFRPCKGSDLKEGDIIPGFRCYPDDIDVLFKEVKGYTLDFELGYILGFYLAEGNVNKPYEVVFSNREEGPRTALLRSLERHGLKARAYENGIRTSDERLYQLVKEFGCGARNKRIPSWVLAAPPEFKVGLISGYFDGDGYLGVAVEAASMSYTLIEDLNVIMASIGVGASMFMGGNARWNGKDYGPSKRLYVFDRDRLFAEVPFHKNFQILRETQGHSTYDIVVFPKQLIDRIGRELRVYSRGEKVKRTFRRFKYKMYNKKTLTRKGALRWIELLKEWGMKEEDEAELRKYVQNPILFEKIVSIEESEYKGLVYDLETDTHNFMTSQGIFVHNSEITMQAIQELGMEGVVHLTMKEVRLYLMEPGEAKGIPWREGDETIWTRPEWLPKLDNFVIFFDDIHLADDYRQSVLFELLLCRRLHGHKVPDSTRFIAAGNLQMSSAAAQEITAPVMDRFNVAIQFEPTWASFIKYATETLHMDKRLITFLSSSGQDYLYTAEPPTSQKFASPRSWVALDKMIKKGYPIEVAPGVVGVEAGSRLVDVWPFLNKRLEDVLKMKVEKMDIGEQVASAAFLAGFQPSERIGRFILRMQPEAQVCYLRLILLTRKEDIPLLYELDCMKELAEQIVKVTDEFAKEGLS